MVCIRLALGLLLIACTAASTSNGTESRPNVVILFFDDHGYGDVGCNTNGTVQETPHIDALAASGVRFTDFHVGFSVCTASRAALLTGRSCPRTGVCGNFGPDSEHGMSLQELTLADLVKQAGYDTHMIGKWHLGHNEPFSPTYRGFDTYYGLPYSGDMGCIDATPQGCKPGTDRSKSQPACPALCAPESAAKPSNVVGIPLYDSRGLNCSGHSSCDSDIVLQPFDPLSLNAQYAARARQIIARYARADSGAGAASASRSASRSASHSASHSVGHSADPFLLYVAFAHTHTPLAYDESRFGNASSRPGRARIFGNTLAELDDAVGQITGALEEAGLAQDTLVLVTADNGPADLGSVACENVGSQGAFQGAWQRSADGGGGGGTAKGTVWEGGHRTVGIASWPGTVRAGRTSPALASSLDFVPTVAALAGVPLPTDRVYDGVDLGPLLRDEPGAAAHDTLFHPIGSGEYPYGVPAMRLGRYKAHWQTTGSLSCFLPDGSHRYGQGKTLRHDPPLVFDLETDPAESTPLDPSTISDVLSRIASAREAFWRSVNSTMRSRTDYKQGGRAYAPCGNVSSPACRTRRSAQAAAPLP